MKKKDIKRMTRGELIDEIERLEDQLAEVDEEQEELDEFEKEMRLNAKKFMIGMKALREETGYSDEDILKLVAIGQGCSQTTVNNIMGK